MTQKNTSQNVIWHHATVTRLRREQKNHHNSVVIWFTGLSGAGKSTLAHYVCFDDYRRWLLFPAMLLLRMESVPVTGTPSPDQPNRRRQ
ncbi:MAG: adenylyl-sulfate kinase [Gammaproteobacteria bacterium]|nr:adenylyl-sulfate kinase [Gammaproteobacteria bacterium]